MTLNSEGLLPCPFCGSEAHIVKRDVEPQGDPWYGKKNELFVECPKCSACLFDEYWHEGFLDKQQAIAAWNRRAPVSTLPGEAEVVALVDRLRLYTDGAFTFPAELIREAADALQAMQARAEKAERERDEAEEAENEAKDCFWAIYPKYLEMGGEPIDTEAARTDLAKRAEAADARVKELEEALGFYADPKNYKGEFVPGGHTDRGTFEMAHHVNIVRKDAGDKARTALKGGSNG